MASPETFSLLLVGEGLGTDGCAFARGGAVGIRRVLVRGEVIGQGGVLLGALLGQRGDHLGMLGGGVGELAYRACWPGQVVELAQRGAELSHRGQAGHDGRQSGTVGMPANWGIGR